MKKGDQLPAQQPAQPTRRPVWGSVRRKLVFPEPGVNTRATNDSTQKELKQMVIFVPAIVCGACVETLRNTLSPFLQPGTKLTADIETKKIKLTLPSRIEITDVINQIKEAGYNEPVPYICEITSEKRKRNEDENENSGNAFDVNTIFSVPDGKTPLTFALQVETARTKNCMEGIVAKLAAMKIAGDKTDDAVITVKANPNATEEEVKGALHQVTNHNFKRCGRP